MFYDLGCHFIALLWIIKMNVIRLKKVYFIVNLILTLLLNFKIKILFLFIIFTKSYDSNFGKYNWTVYFIKYILLVNKYYPTLKLSILLKLVRVTLKMHTSNTSNYFLVKDTTFISARNMLWNFIVLIIFREELCCCFTNSTKFPPIIDTENNVIDSINMEQFQLEDKICILFFCRYSKLLMLTIYISLENFIGLFSRKTIPALKPLPSNTESKWNVEVYYE